MEKIVVQEHGSNVSDSVTLPENILSPHPLPGYQPTHWAFVNALLDRVDQLTGGRAGWFQRFFTYVLIGGFAALVNVAVFSLVFYRISLPLSAPMRNLFANIVAWEVSTLANFLPNDFVTFRHLPGHSRSWFARCTRFHLTSLSGGILTFIIEGGLTFFAHIPAFIAQAIALLIVFVYNFSLHHLFTYRRVKHA